MPLFKTSNPTFGSNTFNGMSDSSYGSGITKYGGAISTTDSMTLSGTVNKTGILLVLAVASAFFTWNQFAATHNPASVSLEMIVGVFGGLIFALITTFKREWSPITAPIYALLEGLFLGAFSSIIDLRYPGIAIQAVGLTFATLFVLLIAYSTGVIKVTQKLRLGIVAATGGICLFYFAEMILGFFGIHFVAINGSGPIGIAVSLFVVAIAALNLVLDFDFIEQGVNQGAPNSWNGTVRSASWSPSSGSTSKSSACYPSFAAATRRIGITTRGAR